MTGWNDGQKAGRQRKKYLWFGYGNYGGLPNLQVGGGNIRDPGLFEALSENLQKERSPIIYFLRAMAVLLGVMLFVMLAAWVITLVLG